MADRVCVRCVVSGRVQGVWFRGSTRSKAVELGLSGSARNLPDGRVEVVACGEASAVERLHQWLWRGPDLAEVTDVRCVTISPDRPFHGFETG